MTPSTGGPECYTLNDHSSRNALNMSRQDGLNILTCKLSYDGHELYMSS